VKRWLLITNSPDRTYLWLDDGEVAEMCADPIGYASVRKFVDGAFASPEPAPWHWEDGDALLLHVEVVVPEPVTTVWALPGKLRSVPNG
jgi:hypothetical protein